MAADDGHHFYRKRLYRHFDGDRNGLSQSRIGAVQGNWESGKMVKGENENKRTLENGEYMDLPMLPTGNQTSGPCTSSILLVLCRVGLASS
jgi:hypothetical protein